MNELEKRKDRYNGILSKYIDGPVRYLIKHNVSPNTLSIIGFLLSLSAAFLIGMGFVHLPLWFSWNVQLLLFGAGVFDIFDGEVARRTGRESQTGAFLDSNLDRISDSAIVIGLIYGGLVDYLLGFIILFVEIMISYTRSRAENEGIGLKGIGLMEREDRIRFLIFATLFESSVFFFTELILGEPFTLAFPILILILTVLLIFTLCQRLIYVFKTLRKSESKEEKAN